MNVVVRLPSWDEMTLHQTTLGAARQHQDDCRTLRVSPGPLQETVEAIEEGLPITLAGINGMTVTYRIQGVLP